MSNQGEFENAGSHGNLPGDDGANDVVAEPFDTQSRSQKTKKGPNSYIQYTMERKKKLLLQDSKKKLDMKKVNDDWKNLRVEEKIVFQEKARSDTRPLKVPSSKKPKKKKVKKSDPQKKKTLSKSKESHEVPSEEATIESLLIKVEELDGKIEGKLGENDQEKNELASVRIRLAVNKNILAMKIDSIESYQAKYSDIMSKHKSCNI